MRAVLLTSATLAAACTNPISNQLFYDDALMVAALPSEQRLGPPREVRLARVGDSELLAVAVAEAAVLDDVTEALARSGDVVRAAEPSERTEVGRRWDAVQAAGDLGGARVSWWVRAEVLWPDDRSALSWTIEMAEDDGGPWVEVGFGAHESDGDGELVWDLGASLEVMGLDPSDAPGTLTGRYETDSDDVRTAELAYTDDTQTAGPWVLVGDVALGWQGQVTLSDADGEPITAYGAVQAIATPEGGWGVAELYPTAEPLDVLTCWNDRGDRVFAEGDLGEEGSPSSCPIDNPL